MRGHWARDCSGNVMGQGIIASLLPNKYVNTALSMAHIYIDGTKCSALIDTGCSRTIVDANRCWSWKRATVDVMTIGSMSRPRCGDGMVNVSTEESGSAKISVLVVRGRPLGFDLLFGIDTIKTLGIIAVGPSGQIQIGNGRVAKCAAITINEPDFTATFDHQSRAWTATWKWSEDRAPEGLHNGVSEYPVAAEIREWKLRTWLARVASRRKTGASQRADSSDGHTTAK